MYSYLDKLPRDQRTLALKEIEKETREGTHNPLPEIARQIYNAERNRRRNMITLGVTTAGLGSVILGVTLNLTPALIGVVGGGSLLIFAGNGIMRYSQVKRDLEDDELTNYLSDDQLRDMDAYQRTFKPVSFEAKEAHSKIKKMCDELLEPEEEPAVEIEATGVKEQPNLGFTEPSPWEPKSNVLEPNNPRSIKLKEDDFTDKIDAAVTGSVAAKFNEELSEIRHVQGEQMNEVMHRMDKFEKTFMAALEANKKLASNLLQDKNAQTPIIIREASIPNPPEAESESDFELPDPPEELRLNFGIFDPKLPEHKNEFRAFRWAVEDEGLSAKGNPIMKRIWGISNGACKNYYAARSRRDQFAARLDEFNGPDYNSLFGE